MPLPPDQLDAAKGSLEKRCLRLSGIAFAAYLRADAAGRAKPGPFGSLPIKQQSLHLPGNAVKIQLRKLEPLIIQSPLLS
ncbi:MAG: hypothetical protein LBC69_02680 [Eubacteriaceae bacterium]|jgi:hypothetical protein|nr:hypothetical protein [Eubacteriaceae bacterium]